MIFAPTFNTTCWLTKHLYTFPSANVLPFTPPHCPRGRVCSCPSGSGYRRAVVPGACRSGVGVGGSLSRVPPQCPFCPSPPPVTGQRCALLAWYVVDSFYMVTPVVHHMPHGVSVCVRPNCTNPSTCCPGRPPPASPCCHVREAQVLHPCAWCTGALRAPSCVPLVSCTPPRVARAPLWLTRVSCAPLWWQGWSALRCARAVVLGSSHPGFVSGSFPFLANQTFPQEPNPNLQGPQGWPSGCPTPCTRAFPQDASGAPSVALGAGSPGCWQKKTMRPLGAASSARWTTIPGYHGGLHGRIPVWGPPSMMLEALFPLV